MTPIQKISRPLIIGATVLGLAASVSTAANAGKEELAIGLLGGLIIGKVISDSSDHQVARDQRTPRYYAPNKRRSHHVHRAHRHHDRRGYHHLKRKRFN